MAATLTIRPRRDEDLPALAAVLVRVHALDGYPVEGVDDPEAWLRHPNEVQSWTAIAAGEPVGQVTLTKATPGDDAARAWSERTGGDLATLLIPVRLFVDPAHRGNGAGRLLMEAVSDYAKAQSSAMAFDVMLKDQTAIRLYERLGAQRVATITHHHGDGLKEPAAVYILPARPVPTDGNVRAAGR